MELILVFKTSLIIGDVTQGLNGLVLECEMMAYHLSGLTVLMINLQ